MKRNHVFWTLVRFSKICRVNAWPIKAYFLRLLFSQIYYRLSLTDKTISKPRGICVAVPAVPPLASEHYKAKNLSVPLGNRFVSHVQMKRGRPLSLSGQVTFQK